MKSLLFVLVGLSDSNPEETIVHLQSQIQEALNNEGIAVTADRKGLLITIRFEEISFYSSLASDKSEMKDWFRLAKDFELKVNKKPIQRPELELQYSKLRSHDMEKYKPTYFSIVRIVFEELMKLDAQVYAFH